MGWLDAYLTPKTEWKGKARGFKSARRQCVEHDLDGGWSCVLNCGSVAIVPERGRQKSRPIFCARPCSQERQVHEVGINGAGQTRP